MKNIRQSGRTTKMLTDALHFAHMYPTTPVNVFAHTSQFARTLRDMTMALASKINMTPVPSNISFHSAASTPTHSFGWRDGVPFVDHVVFEGYVPRQMDHLLQYLDRMQAKYGYS